MHRNCHYVNEKTEKKKEEMIRSALNMISEKGYHATTMEDIELSY
ncbi:TetR family transcriptional regulator [Bacillus andreraoultii]|nr:TetR family transcriptional regulator [Bacillus andreraoultii]